MQQFYEFVNGLRLLQGDCSGTTEKGTSIECSNEQPVLPVVRETGVDDVRRSRRHTLCQTHVSPEQLNLVEPFYPLHALVCDACLLVQLDEYVAPDYIFSEYAYFSSYSDSWLKHAAHVGQFAQLPNVERLHADEASAGLHDMGCEVCGADPEA